MEKIIIKGRVAVGGKVTGEALVFPDGLSSYNGLDPDTGIVTAYDNINRGKNIKDKILVMPGSKGSNGWSCIFGVLRVGGNAPAGWLFSHIDSSSGVASAVLNIPTVVDFSDNQDPCLLIKGGDMITIDGDNGEVTIIKTEG